MSATSQCKSIFNKISLLFALASMLLCLFVRLCAGSPFDLIHKLHATQILPPMWLFNLLSLFWSFLAGFGAGIIVSEVSSGRLRGEKEILAYRGGLFFVTLLLLSQFWYPLFFVGERLLLSLLLSLIASLCAVFCAVLWAKPSPPSALVIATYGFWLLYTVFLNLTVLLHI